MRRWKKAVLEVATVVGVIWLKVVEWKTSWGWFLAAATVYGGATITRLVCESWKLRTSKEIAIQSHLRDFPREFFGEPRPDLCITVLLPDKRGRYVRPRYRFSPYAPDGVKGKCKSRARFQKKSALAGFAWENPRKLYFNEEKLGPFTSKDDFRDYYRSVFQMPDKLIDYLNYERMKNVQSIMCLGIINREDYICGILSVDSTEADAFEDIDERKLVSYVRGLASFLRDVPE